MSKKINSGVVEVLLRDFVLRAKGENGRSGGIKQSIEKKIKRVSRGGFEGPTCYEREGSFCVSIVRAIEKRTS